VVVTKEPFERKEKEIKGAENREMDA